MSAWNECDNEYKRLCCEKFEHAHVKLRFART